MLKHRRFVVSTRGGESKLLGSAGGKGLWCWRSICDGAELKARFPKMAQGQYFRRSLESIRIDIRVVAAFASCYGVNLAFSAAGFGLFFGLGARLGGLTWPGWRATQVGKRQVARAAPAGRCRWCRGTPKRRALWGEPGLFSGGVCGARGWLIPGSACQAPTTGNGFSLNQAASAR